MRRSTSSDANAAARLRLRVDGLVQGVGFRPYVYRLAQELQLAGFVFNDSLGVLIEIEGAPSQIEQFTQRLRSEAPRQARIVTVHADPLAATGEEGFEIRESVVRAVPSTQISPDIATCDGCLAEFFDANDRRYRYPFLNCTNCGPRFTIVRSVPYDRPNTSMAAFAMCPECEREYHDPNNRRFHAQPNACPKCGPSVSLWNRTEQLDAQDPIAEAVTLLRSGAIIAVRGVGGFHLAVDAENEQAVQELRLRKGRAEKPFAIMSPTIEAVRSFSEPTEAETALLADPRRPIVLLRKKIGNRLAKSVAPRNHYFGVMLPYTPVHHLLLRGNFIALVMTSGNLSEEPIAIHNDEALERLSAIADYFLLHDREILQRCDDSIVRALGGTVYPIRRARGFVPEPLSLAAPLTHQVLAVGGHLKNTIALGRGSNVFLSQHIGNLDNPSALSFFGHAIDHLRTTLGIHPNLIACDTHPEYLSTKWAAGQNELPVVKVQHHHAHLVSVMAENQVTERTIGIVLDGTGYGLDGTIWGGEVLIGDASGFERFAWLEPIPMPGGEKAVEQPWRMAVSLLYHVYGPRFHELELPFLRRHTQEELTILTQMIAQRINCPLTSSCGRLFDAFAALLDIRHEVTYEAQAAIELETIASSYAFQAEPMRETLAEPSRRILDYRPLVTTIVNAIHSGMAVEQLAAEFHSGIAEIFVESARAAREVSGIETVALSGGVYQNALFFGRIRSRLEQEQFRVLTHTKVPCNDGGLSLGQILIADYQRTSGKG